MNISQWLVWARDTLARSGCPDPAVDSKWIAEDTLGLTRAQLHFSADRELTEDERTELDGRLSRRAHGEPVQYILSSACFMGLNFYVDKRVLIPRQDTETLVESAVIALRGKPGAKVLDMCAGSGAVGISLKTLSPDADITLTDVSRDALDVARRNARDLNADVRLRQGDLFDAIGNDKFDIIVSNPPYIPRDDLAGLQKEISFEPREALDGGTDGLDFYRRISSGAQAHLNPEGAIYLEVGAGESEDVLKLLASNMDCASTGAENDLNGIPRVVWARIN